MSLQDIKVSVDAVVFGYSSQTGLSVLLIKRKKEPFQHCWALPGGLVKDNESLEEAVERELHEESGVSINYLEQLYSFGKPDRDPRNRVISVAYFGLVSPEAFTLNASTDAEEAKWFSMLELPDLAFDHAEILDLAFKRLQGKIRYEPVGFELLTEKFPFSDLEKLYSSLLGEPVDRRNFKKKIMKLGFLEQLDEKQQLSSAGRPGFLYTFNKESYFELKEKGFNFWV